MLTKEKMQEIKAEEIFRDEVRKKLGEKKGKSFGRKLWRFMNSSLGLWILSTVVVGLIVPFYNKIKLQAEISANNTATLQKLETEASNRLQQFYVSISSQDPSKIYNQKEELAYMIDGILFSGVGLGNKKPVYIFPEYKERTMNSLLYEIERLTSDKKEILMIKEARKILIKIQDSLLKIEGPPTHKFTISPWIQKKTQTGQPLTLDEKRQLDEYEKKEKKFKEGPLLEYNKRIKNKLSALLILFQSNSFLAKLCEIE